MTALLLCLILHGDGVSSSRIDVDGCEARVTFTFSMEDLSELARLDLNRNGSVEPEEWTQVLPAIFSYLGEQFRIEGCRSEGDLDLVPSPTALKDRRAPGTLRMRYLSVQPLSRLRIRCTLFQEHEGAPRHVAELPGGRVIVFDRERPEEDGSAPGPSTSTAVLLALGVASVLIINAIRAAAA